jgi:hypothetical protein
VRQGLTRRWLFAGLVLALAVGLWAQNRVDILNGVSYIFPSSQGATDKILANDGSGNLTWATPASAEGLWTSSIVLSTVSCPSGWTRVSAADGRALRGSGATGGTGGSDTHGHTLSGITAATTPAVTGTTASSGVSITGSTDATSVSHTHGTTTGTAGLDHFTGGARAVTSVSVNSADPGHSHGAGTLGGSSHTHTAGTLAVSGHGHGVGTLATASASSLAAYYGLILCSKD